MGVLKSDVGATNSPYCSCNDDGIAGLSNFESRKIRDLYGAVKLRLIRFCARSHVYVEFVVFAVNRSKVRQIPCPSDPQPFVGFADFKLLETGKGCKMGPYLLGCWGIVVFE